jgi:hypothetical protein
MYSLSPNKIEKENRLSLTSSQGDTNDQYTGMGPKLHSDAIEMKFTILCMSKTIG